MLTPICVASLCARIHHWWGMVVDAWPYLCHLIECSCPPLVGDDGRCLPPFVPLIVCSPLFVSPCCMAPLLHVGVVVSVGGALIGVLEQEGLPLV